MGGVGKCSLIGFAGLFFHSISAFSSSSDLSSVQMPAGFKIEVFADKVNGARSLSLGPDGTVFVGSRNEGKVYALVDNDKDFKADEVIVLAKGLNSPNGVAYKDGSLFIAEIAKISKIENVMVDLKAPKTLKTVYDKYPSDRHHGWKFIRFGPDGYLYVPVGAPCNICEKDNRIYSSITRLSVSGESMEIFASGVRNSVGFDWHPETKELWFTENGRDVMGDDIPADELNRAPKAGLHFGYPYCHQGDLLDPQFGGGKKCADYVPPAQKLGPHVAALGMRYYLGTQFPEKYRKGFFIAEHGSWNRTEPLGYRVSFVPTQRDSALGYEIFAQGFRNARGQVWGRPVDVEVYTDGSLLVSDDQGDAVYRITYAEKATPNINAKPATTRKTRPDKSKK